MWRDRLDGVLSARPEEAREFGEALSTVEGMALNWGHDVNNPLAVVMANLEILLDLVNEASDGLSELGPPTPREARWLATVDVCLRDACEGARRIQMVARQMIITGNEASLSSDALSHAFSRAGGDPSED